MDRQKGIRRIRWMNKVAEFIQTSKQDPLIPVIVRLILPSRARDGEITVYHYFVKRIHVSATCLRDGMSVILYVGTEGHRFDDPKLFWDEHLGCTMEVVWLKVDDFDFLKSVGQDSDWMAKPIM